MNIPADVPRYAARDYRTRYTLLTKGTDNLLLFSADHKIEHLDRDFHGPNVDTAAHDPDHLFNIAAQSPIGAMATQLGLIAQYGKHYPTIPYVVKLNSKTNIIPRSEKDPLSRLLWTVDDVVSFKKNSELTIAGIGVTVYLGSDSEDIMLEQAAQSIYNAHQHGLVAIIWMYPRGKAVSDETDPELLAGAVGVAAALGADFVKIHPLSPEVSDHENLYKFIAQAAGTTKVLCAGGAFKDQKTLLHDVSIQMKNGISGAALGRSIFQHSLSDAVKLCQSLSEIIYKH